MFIFTTLRVSHRIQNKQRVVLPIKLHDCKLQGEPVLSRNGPLAAGRSVTAAGKRFALRVELIGHRKYPKFRDSIKYRTSELWPLASHNGCVNDLPGRGFPSIRKLQLDPEGCRL